MSPRDPLKAAQEDGGLAFFNGKGGSIGVFPGTAGTAVLRHMTYRDDRFDTLEIPLTRTDLLRLYAFIGELVMLDGQRRQPESTEPIPAALERLRRDGFPPWRGPDGEAHAEQRQALPAWPHPLVPRVHYPEQNEMSRARINELRALIEAEWNAHGDGMHPTMAKLLEVVSTLVDQVVYLKAARAGLVEALRQRGYP